eukprot:6198753-Pleurochrysis_carterae.AAC.1
MSQLSEETLALMRTAMKRIRPVGAYDKAHNDECIYSFDTPFSPSGLYVNMRTFNGVGEAYLEVDAKKEGADPVLYLHLREKRVPKQPTDEAKIGASETAPTRMAIGGEGGFKVDEDKYDIVKEQAIFLMPNRISVPLPCADIPELISEAARALISKTSVLAEEKAAAIAWEAHVAESKYARDLVQLPAHKQISPDSSTWVCEVSGMRENLWLNLSDGHIGSGRRHYDGSGGANGALDHYKETKKHFPPHGFPLVVKLGTITPHGADVYSYAEDEDTEERRSFDEKQHA